MKLNFLNIIAKWERPILKKIGIIHKIYGINNKIFYFHTKERNIMKQCNDISRIIRITSIPEKRKYLKKNEIKETIYNFLFYFKQNIIF